MNPIEVGIVITLYQPGMGGQLRLEENMKIAPAASFLDLANIMKQFHELAVAIRDANRIPEAKR